jgi:hypothetical protein
VHAVEFSRIGCAWEFLAKEISRAAIQIHHFLKTQKPRRFFTSFLDDGPSILGQKFEVKKPLLRLRLAVLEPVFYAEIQALGNLTRLRCRKP